MIRIPTHRCPVHPGEMLALEFLEPYGLTQVELARRLEVPVQRVNQIVNGRRGITPDTALRLARFFDTTPELWLDLQRTWDLYETVNSPAAARFERIRPISSDPVGTR